MDGDFDTLPDKHRTCVYRIVQGDDQLRAARAGAGDSSTSVPGMVSYKCWSSTTA